MKKTAALVLLLLFVSTLTLNVYARSRKKRDLPEFFSGAIVIPYENNVNLKEGTFETWVSTVYQPGTNLELPVEGGIQAITLMRTKTLGVGSNKHLDQEITPARINIAINQIEGGRDESIYGHFTYFSRKYSEGVYIDNFGISFLDQLKWNKEEWHYIAVTWKLIGDNKSEVKAYCDGKIFVNDKFELLEDVLKSDNNNVIIFGDIRYNFSAINEIRISSNAKTDEEIAAQAGKKFTKEKTTLVLLNSASLSKMRKVKAHEHDWTYTRTYVFPSNLKVPRNGAIVGYYKYIKGKFGKAVKLSKYNKE